MAIQRPPRAASKLRVWLLRTVRRMVLQRRRESLHRRDREKHAATAGPLVSADELVERVGMHHVLVDEVTALQEPYRSTIILRFFEGLSPQEMSRRDGIPVATVQSRLTRALALLRKRLDRRCRGDRGQWLSALLPLTGPGPMPAGAPSGGNLVSTTTVLETSRGALAMSAHAKITAAAVALLGTFAMVAYRNRSPEPVDPGPQALAATDGLQLTSPELKATEDLASPEKTGETRTEPPVVKPARADPTPRLVDQVEGGEIGPFLSASPGIVEFGKISVGDVATRQSTIQAARATPVMLQLVEGDLPAGVSHELKPTNPDVEGKSARWELALTLGPKLAEGHLARSLTIRSDVPIPEPGRQTGGTPMTYQVSLTMSAHVISPFTHQPPYLSMGLIRPGRVVTRTVRVESHEEEYSFAENQPEVRLMGQQLPGTDEFQEWEYAEAFTPTIRPVEGMNAIDVELRLEELPEGAAGPFRGTMLIELDHPCVNWIAVVVTGVCRDGQW